MGGVGWGSMDVCGVMVGWDSTKCAHGTASVKKNSVIRMLWL